MTIVGKLWGVGRLLGGCRKYMSTCGELTT